MFRLTATLGVSRLLMSVLAFPCHTCFLVPVQRTLSSSIELSDEFGHVSVRTVGTGLSTSKKDRNLEKTRTRTLNTVKGKTPRPIHNEDAPVIPEGNLFPLNLDPPSTNPVSQSGSERGAYYLIRSSPSPLPFLILFIFSHCHTFLDALPRPSVISPLCVFS